jgi:hypothetical protein
MMKTRMFLAMIVLTALVLPACAKAPQPLAYPVEGMRITESDELPAVAEVPAAVEAVSPAGQPSGDMKMAPAPTTVPNSTVAGAGGELYPVSLPQSGGGMLIKDAALELYVKDINLAVDRVTQLAADQGGYIINSQITTRDDDQYALLKLGIPSQEFEHTLNELRKISEQVISETASGQDVGAEYTDLKSRLANLEATAARVRQFLEQANTVEESLRINQTLSELEGQIEQVKGQMRYYEGRAAFSTVTVSLTDQPPASIPTPVPGWDPANTLGNASSVLVKLLQVVVDVLIWLAVLLGPLALVAGAALIFVRSLRRMAPKA